MSGAQSISTRRAYGVQRVCRVTPYGGREDRAPIYNIQLVFCGPEPASRRRGNDGA